MIRGSALRVAGNVAGIVVGVAAAVLLLRHLGVADSGRYVTVLSLVAIAGSASENGLNVSASPELALRLPRRTCGARREHLRAATHRQAAGRGPEYICTRAGRYTF